MDHDLSRRLRVTSDGDALAGVGGGAPWADVDRLWTLALDGGLRAPAFRLITDGTTLPRGSICRSGSVGDRTLDDLIEPNRVLELHDDGATLVMQGLQHFDRDYGRLSTNLALELSQPIQVNAYLSPPNARGLNIHFDYHDVIVVQLAGSKRWRVWEPIERSLRPTRHGPGVPMPQLDELGEPLFERVVGPGDCLAIPRGFPHAAETVDDGSVHLTIGIMSFTWERVVRLVLASGLSGSGVSGTALADRLRSVPEPGAALSDLADLLADDGLQRLVTAEVWRRQPRTRLRPRAVGPSAPLDAAATFRVTPGPLLWLECDGSRARLQLGDRSISAPLEAAPLFERVLTTAGCFGLDDVRGELDAASAVVIIERLMREGVVAHA